jgi:phosphoglycolate phosphatase
MDILVDLDGTLVDPKPGIIGSFQYALDRLGARVPPAEDLLWVIGPPLRTSFPKLLGSTQRTEEAVALYRENYLGGAMYDAVVYQGVTGALDALAASGCRLFVATAKPHFYARPILEHFDLARRFSAIHGPELDGTRDHKSDLIAHMVAEHRIRPETALMIGDREHDVIAAARNGMRTLGVTWGYGSTEELTAAGVAALCPSPADLAEAVLGLMRHAA